MTWPKEEHWINGGTIEARRLGEGRTGRREGANGRKKCGEEKRTREGNIVGEIKEGERERKHSEDRESESERLLEGCAR